MKQHHNIHIVNIYSFILVIFKFMGKVLFLFVVIIFSINVLWFQNFKGSDFL